MNPSQAILDALDQALPQLPLEPEEAVTGRRMFGGFCYLVNGKMLAGVAKAQLVIRLEEEEFTEASRTGLVTPMDFTGRPLSGFAYVAPEAFSTEAELLAWLEMSLRYVRKHMLAKKRKRSAK
jgi:TfoX/Sxy family transcriptional regulator of competence genes